MPSTRACSDAERSPAPKISASSRTLACAMSTALASPSASSMRTSSPMGRSRPRDASSWPKRTSTHQTSRARRTLGTIRTSRHSRAPLTTSMMSPWHHGVSMPLTRTARTVRPQSRPVSAPTTTAREDSLTPGAQASSRSRKTRSAPTDAAFSHMRSLLAGVASSERRALGARTTDSLSDGACGIRWCLRPAAPRDARGPRRAGRRERRRCPRPGRGPGSPLRPVSRSGAPRAPGPSWSRDQGPAPR